MEKHPRFISNPIDGGQDLPPLVEALQQLKYDVDENSPEGGQKGAPTVGENPYVQSPGLSYRSQVPIAINEQATIDPACLTSYEGHKVTLQLIDGNWVATVSENLPTGFINEVQLPVYIDPAITVNWLLEATPGFQKRHIRVAFPRSREGGKGFVFIGNVGLRGGGPVSSRLYKVEGFTPLSDHITWPRLDNCNIGEAIAEVAKACESDAPYLWADNGSRGPFRSGSPKCNLFVAEVLANIGLYTASHGESGWRQFTIRIPTASDWANDRVPRFNVTLDPKPGSIVAQKYGFRDATGHVGIVVNYGETVCTNSYLEGKLNRNDFGFRTETDSKGEKVFGHKNDVVYLNHTDNTSGLYTIIPDDIMYCFR